MSAPVARGGMDGMRMLGALVTLALLLAGCTTVPGAPVPTSTATPSAGPRSLGPVQPAGEPTVIATGLASPWSMVRLAGGSVLISERSTALVKELTADGALRVVGAVPGVVPEGEGGLLGLAVADDDLYAYFTSATDNRIVRFALEGAPGAYALGAGEEILTGIAKAGNHDGGRIAFGPDGMLFATVGDAADPARSQDPGSLNGKILRMQPDGAVPDDNPFPGSLVYSLGHRNPQGIAWDRDGRLWAAEFGQNTWDEFNLIEPGANYGWPVVEGASPDPAFVNPVYQWPTSEASPSGLAYTRDTFFLAALRGERLWAIYPEPSGTQAVGWFAGENGRIRDVIPGPDGSVWMLTNNTDGRGEPREGDDRILQVELAPLADPPAEPGRG